MRKLLGLGGSNPHWFRVHATGIDGESNGTDSFLWTYHGFISPTAPGWPRGSCRTLWVLVLRRLLLGLWLGLAAVGSTGAQEADLELSLRGADSVTRAASRLSFTLTVENLGPGVAYDVTVIDRLPQGVIFVSASDECAYSDVVHEVSCVAAGIDPGVSREFSIDVMIGRSGAEIGVVLTSSNPPAVFMRSRIAGDAVISAGGRLMAPRGIAREAGGALLIADLGDPRPAIGGSPLTDGNIIRVDSGAQTLLSSGGFLLNPTGITVDGRGRIFVADATGVVMPEQLGRVIEIDPVDGSQRLLARGGFLQHPVGIVALGVEALMVADGAGRLVRIDSDGGAQTLVSEYGNLWEPRAVARLGPGTVVVADRVSGLVRVEIENGEQRVLLPIDDMELSGPLDIEIDPEGHCWVVDSASDGARAVLLIDSKGGILAESRSGGDRGPALEGLELLHVLSNVAAVSSLTSDPDPSNDTDWVAIEVVDGPRPRVDGQAADSVRSTDGEEARLPASVAVNITESVVVADVAGAFPAVEIHVVEKLRVEDIVAALGPVTIGLAEDVIVDDRVAALPPASVAISEEMVVTDDPAALPPENVHLGEKVFVGDIVAALGPVAIGLVEDVIVDDRVAALPPANLHLAENVFVADFVAALGPVAVSIVESVDIGDTIDMTRNPIFIDGFESGDASAWSAQFGNRSAPDTIVVNPGVRSGLQNPTEASLREAQTNSRRQEEER